MKLHNALKIKKFFAYDRSIITDVSSQYQFSMLPEN